MDFESILSNKWVWIAAAVIGGYVVVSSLSGGGSAGGTTNTNMNSAAFNAAGLSAAEAFSHDNAAVSVASFANSSQLQASLLSAFVSLGNQNAQVQINQNTVLGQLGMSQITQGTQIALERYQDANRIGLAQIGLANTKLITDAQVQSTTIQANAAKKISDNNMWSGIAKSVISIIPKALTAVGA